MTFDIKKHVYKSTTIAFLLFFSSLSSGDYIPATFKISVPGYKYFYLTGTLHACSDSTFNEIKDSLVSIHDDSDWYASETFIDNSVLEMAKKATSIPNEYFDFLRSFENFEVIDGYEFMSDFFKKYKDKKTCNLCLEKFLQDSAMRKKIKFLKLDDDYTHESRLKEHHVFFDKWRKLPESIRWGFAIEKMKHSEEHLLIEYVWEVLKDPYLVIHSEILDELAVYDSETMHRNETMIKRLLEFASEETGHAVIGINHLVGPLGLLEVFKKLGAKLELVPLNQKQPDFALNID